MPTPNMNDWELLQAYAVEDVLPGDYRLQIQVTQPPKDPLDPEGGFSFTPEIGSLTKDIAVPEASVDQPEQPFDSGVIRLLFKEAGKTAE